MCNSNYNDNEMINRISKHKIERENKFITIEETQNLAKHINSGKTYLIDCISMWILNSIEKTEHELIRDIEKLSKIDANIIFVLNNLCFFWHNPYLIKGINRYFCCL
jgi:adenosylcobinamide kinase/adenosylcobinamide-phosphate guanylyltransferase